MKLKQEDGRENENSRSWFFEQIQSRKALPRLAKQRGTQSYWHQRGELASKKWEGDEEGLWITLWLQTDWYHWSLPER